MAEDDTKLSSLIDLQLLPKSVLSDVVAGVYAGSKRFAGVYTGFDENTDAWHRLQ